MRTYLANSLRIVIYVTSIACLTNGQARGQFSTVLNIPPQPNLGSNQSIGSSTQLNLFAGGAIGGFLDVGTADGMSSNVEVNIQGGVVNDVLQAYGAGATVNISGGTVGRVVRALNGATINITSGTVGDFLLVAEGGEVNISGGSVGDESDVGRQLDLNSGAVANISGGSVGIHANAFGNSVVTISGGSVGFNFGARDKSLVKITGGTVGNSFHALEQSVIELSGGVIGNNASLDGGDLHMSGGSVGSNFRMHDGSIFNLSGGAVGDYLFATAGSTLNLHGTQFVLGGIDITASLTPNMPHTIAARDVVIEGLLADGSPFDFKLNTTGPRIGPFESFDLNATLTVTRVLVPEPQSLVLLASLAAYVLKIRRDAASACARRSPSSRSAQSSSA
jgi:hypothetical protein